MRCSDAARLMTNARNSSSDRLIGFGCRWSCRARHPPSREGCQPGRARLTEMAITGRRDGASQRSNDSSRGRWMATQPAVVASSQLCTKIPDPGAPGPRRIGWALNSITARYG